MKDITITTLKHIYLTMLADNYNSELRMLIIKLIAGLEDVNN